MPRRIENKFTIKNLIQNTYLQQKNRFDNRDRDVLKSIKVKKVSSYELSSTRIRTKFIIETSSYPQYYPYFTKKDSRGRDRSYQRSYKHHYDVTIQLERLSINVPVKLRTGSDLKWDFSKEGRTKKVNGRVIEGTNIKRGINADFFFRLEFLYHKAGILFGRNWTNGPPTKVNPSGIIFLDKHMLRATEVLMSRGILKDD